MSFSQFSEDFKHWIKEDAPYGDETSEAVIHEGLRLKAAVVAKSNGIVAGMIFVKEALPEFKINVVSGVKDGTPVKAGDTVLVIEGPAREILLVERTLLNFLSHCSGVATATRHLSIEAAKTKKQVRVAATRKTTLGLRIYEKAAVRIGGGDTHRMSLSDALLIKDNHIKAAGGLANAIKEAKHWTSFTKKIEIEVASKKEALEAARLGSDIIMLDNFTPKNALKTLKALEKAGLRDKVLVELSGGIHPDNIKEYAKLDADVISSGWITNSAGIVDMNLEVLEDWGKKRG